MIGTDLTIQRVTRAREAHAAACRAPAADAARGADPASGPDEARCLPCTRPAPRAPVEWRHTRHAGDRSHDRALKAPRGPIRRRLRLHRRRVCAAVRRQDLVVRLGLHPLGRHLRRGQHLERRVLSPRRPHGALLRQPADDAPGDPVQPRRAAADPARLRARRRLEGCLCRDGLHARRAAARCARPAAGAEPLLCVRPALRVDRVARETASRHRPAHQRAPAHRRRVGGPAGQELPLDRPRAVDVRCLRPRPRHQLRRRRARQRHRRAGLQRVHGARTAWCTPPSTACSKASRAAPRSSCASACASRCASRRCRPHAVRNADEVFLTSTGGGILRSPRSTASR